MNRKKVLFGSAAFALVLAGSYGYREFTRTHKDLLHEQPAVVLPASALIAAYENDTAAFQQKYTDRVIAVTGQIRQIDSEGNPVVIAISGDMGMSSVQCSMDSAYTDLYKNLSESQTITLKGIYTGGRTDDLFGTDVIMHRCVPHQTN